MKETVQVSEQSEGAYKNEMESGITVCKKTAQGDTHTSLYIAQS